MAEIAGLSVQISATTALLQSQLREAERRISTFERATNTAAGKVDQNVSRMGEAAGGLRGQMDAIAAVAPKVQAALAAVGAGALATKVIQTTAEFQKLGTSMKTVVGSAELASQAMGALQDFAAKTPFSLQQAVQGFVALKARGLDPSIKSLESYGNTASAMGKDLSQMIEAVADAATGEFERLKEFGIVASSEGDRVKLTFQGVTTEVGKNAQEIESYLRRIGETQFAGAMQEQAATLGGALSNLEDSWNRLFVSIGNAGAGDAANGAIRGLTEAIEALSANMGDLVQGGLLVTKVLGGLLVAKMASAAIGGLAASVAASVAALKAKDAAIIKTAADTVIMAKADQMAAQHAFASAQATVAVQTARQAAAVAAVRNTAGLSGQAAAVARLDVANLALAQSEAAVAAAQTAVARSSVAATMAHTAHATAVARTTLAARAAAAASATAAAATTGLAAAMAAVGLNTPIGRLVATAAMLYEMMTTTEQAVVATRASTDAAIKQGEAHLIATGKISQYTDALFGNTEEQKKNLTARLEMLKFEQRALRFMASNPTRTNSATDFARITEGLNILDKAIDETGEALGKLSGTGGGSSGGGLSAVTTATEEATDKVEEYITSLSDAARMAELDAKEREIEEAVLRAQNLALEENNALTVEQIDRIRGLVKARQEQEEATRKAQEAEQEAKRAAEEAAATMPRMFDRAFDRIGDGLVDLALKGKDAMASLANIGRAVVSSLLSDFAKLASVDLRRMIGMGTKGDVGLSDVFSVGGTAGKSVSGLGARDYISLGSSMGSVYTGTNTLGTLANGFATSSMGQGLGLSTAYVDTIGATQIVNPAMLSPAGQTFTGVASGIGSAIPYGMIGGMGGAWLGNNVFGGSKVAGGLSGAALGVGSMAAGTAAMGAMGMGAAASAAGVSGMAGASAALSAIPVYGWIAAAVLAAVTAVLGTSKPSTMYSGAWVDTDAAGNVMASDAGGKSGTNVEGIKSATEGVSSAINTLIQQTGMKQTGNLWLGIENDTKGTRAKVGGWNGDVVSSSADPGRIMLDTLRYMLDRETSVAGKPTLDADALVEKAIRNSKATTGEEATKDVLAGATLARINKFTAQGYNPFDEQITQWLAQAAEAGKAAKEQWVDLHSRIVALDLAPAAEATQTLRRAFEDSALGLGATYTPLRGLAAVTKQAEINIEALRPTMEALGYTAEEQAGLIRQYTDKMQADYMRQVGYITLGGTATLERAISDNYRIPAGDVLRSLGLDQLQWADAGMATAFQGIIAAEDAGTASAADLRAMLGNLNKELAEGAITAEQYGSLVQTMADRYQKVNEASQIRLQTLDQEAQRLTALALREQQWRASSLIGDMSPLSPQAKLNEGLRQYNDLLAKAQAGDVLAQDQISGVRDAVLKIAKDYYASSQGYVDIFNRMQADSQSFETVAQSQLSEARRQTGILEGILNAANTSRVRGVGENFDPWTAQIGNVSVGAERMWGIERGYTGVFGAGGYQAWIDQMGLRSAYQAFIGNGMADGGLVTGGIPGRDSVPTMLMPGERVFSVPHARMIERLAANANATNDNGAVVEELRESNRLLRAQIYESNQSRAELGRLRRENAALRSQLADRDAAQPRTGTYR
ncbi:MAG TPA: tape measure protein [Azospirillum sp.]|nr:tape measure protein [Azospirillum sp.]